DRGVRAPLGELAVAEEVRLEELELLVRQQIGEEAVGLATLGEVLGDGILPQLSAGVEGLDLLGETGKGGEGGHGDSPLAPPSPAFNVAERQTGSGNSRGRVPNRVRMVAPRATQVAAASTSLPSTGMSWRTRSTRIPRARTAAWVFRFARSTGSRVPTSEATAE